ncbi:MAG TPA: FtsQ-type POTRA domain-containing protein [Spirochaetia bacterium]|nr:FtsQ-type POTRA domain-containing protein [Spirochaetia bacterium]
MSNLDSILDAQHTAGRGDGAARWTRPLVAVLTVVCAVVLLGRFAGEPLTRIRHVTVHSDVPLSDDQILSLSGIPAGAHWYSVSAQEIQQRLEASPLVYRARVQRVFPDTVRMTVWARQPAALVLAAVQGRSLPVLVDGDGVVYKVGSSGPELDLPVVSGLAVGDASLGARLPRHYGALFADLRALREKAPALYGAISEVRVAAPGPQGDPSAASASPQELELLVYLTSARVPIRTRGAIDEGFVKYALMVLDLLSRQGVLQNIQELDFRNGDAVYRTRGSNAPAVPAEGG